MGALGFLPPVRVGTHVIVLPEFAAKITGTCETCFFRYGSDRFLRFTEQLCSLRQPVLDEISHRGYVNARLENVQGAALADGGGCRDHFERDFCCIVVMDVLHHRLQPRLAVVEAVEVRGAGG